MRRREVKASFKRNQRISEEKIEETNNKDGEIKEQRTSQSGKEGASDKAQKLK